MGGKDAGGVAPLQGSDDHWDWQERQDKLFADDAPPAQPESSSGVVVAAQSSKQGEGVFRHASASSVLRQVQEEDAAGPLKLLKGIGKDFLGLFGVLIGGVPKLVSAVLVGGLSIAAIPVGIAGMVLGFLFHPVINATRSESGKKGVFEDVIAGYRVTAGITIGLAGVIPLAITSGFEYAGGWMLEEAKWKEKETPRTLIGMIFNKKDKDKGI